ncbi:PREDICTED: alpha-1B-glycoprotein-like [Haliaeetus leucocephalus]|uniref:alpha-1B-glycoprotein-like n=1 Tax=Haliaeetus leucocephalus TaxID=52644 RepID=UPI00053CD703|nr:PREDICTED: alpha-1B-glycoprotein-like [Haliaeetus leucocephalus]
MTFSSLLSSQCNFLAAFLQLLPLAVSFADLLPVPILSADPRHDVYYEGERVTMTCSAPTMRKIGGFRFFNQTGEQIDLQTPYSLATAWLHLTATKASSGEYTCMYFLKESGQEIPSNRSLPLSLKVQAAPTAPTLSLDPQQQVYRPGNHVNLVCSFPSSSDDVKQVQYYADTGFAVSVRVSNVKNHSFNLRITGDMVSGSYSCAYFVNKATCPIRSELSPSVIVYVKSEFSNPSSLEHLVTTDPSLVNSLPVCLPMNSSMSLISIPSCPVSIRLSASDSLSIII